MSIDRDEVFIYELRDEKGGGADRWILSPDVDEFVFTPVFRSEAMAQRAADLLSMVVTIGATTDYKRRMREWMYFWDKKVDEEGKPYETIGEEDRDFSRLKAILKKEIDEQLGFDRENDCPSKDYRHGYCEGCPMLEWDADKKRFSCLHRKEVVDTLRALAGEDEDV